MSRPHPFEKGRGGCGCVLASEGARARLLDPHPSLEGRGSWPDGWGWLGANCSGEAKVSGGEDERGRTKINHDVVDGGLKLRSPQ
jgi:hypothetical protein